MFKSKIVLVNKDSDKPKRSAFKRPTLYIQYRWQQYNPNQWKYFFTSYFS